MISVAETKALIDRQFTLQRPMLGLWQTLADHFYPERADFTITRNAGPDIADLLTDSYPVLVRRDLANSFAAMLRDGDWFSMTTNNEPDHEGRMWLQWATHRLKTLMYDRSSGFVRSTKEGDHDYATFGQTVISIEKNRKMDGLLFRTWHLRDCAWWENENREVEGVARKDKMTYRQAISFFGEDNVHQKVREGVKKKPFDEITVFHACLPSEMYGKEELEKYPYVSVFIDATNSELMEEVGLTYQMYNVPRFQTIAGSPYAFSPATMVGLPDARTLQAMTHTLLEAGERYARPPIVATSKVIDSAVDLSPDGITWVDKEYDEKLGASLRPLFSDKSGFPIGLEMRENVVEILASAFYLNKISLPDLGREMTAYEVSQRMKQFRRESLPLFAPLEAEYNGRICEAAFGLAMNMGLMGSPYDIPRSLSGSEVMFKFQSPLSRSEEEERAAKFQQVGQMLAEAAQVDPHVADNVDIDTAFREAVLGLGAPAKWLNTEEEIMQKRQLEAVAQLATVASGVQ